MTSPTSLSSISTNVDSQIITKMAHALFIHSNHLDNEIMFENSTETCNNFYNTNMPLSHFLHQADANHNSKNLIQDLLDDRSSQEDYLAIIRNRFNSCSSLELYRASLTNSSANNSSWNLEESQPSVENFLTPHNLFQNQRRHNSFNIPNDCMPNINQVGSDSSFFENSFKQSLASSDRTNSKISDDSSFTPTIIECLDNNCSINYDPNHVMNQEKNFVKFQCSSCKINRTMHRFCFDKKMKLNRRRNSYNTPQISKKQSIKEIYFNCMVCQNGFLKPLNYFINDPINKQGRGSKVVTDFNNNSINSKANKSYPQLQQSDKNFSKFNKAQSKTCQLSQSQGSNQNSQNFCKKPANHSGQPMNSSYMTSVRESRSPSPNSYSLLNVKRQSMPVNMPKGRLRTISTESVASFTPTSSFSSSFINSQSNGLSASTPKKHGLQNIHRKYSLQTTQTPRNSFVSQNTNFLSVSSSQLNDLVLEEKLAQSGNMFNSRKDWSILNQVPLNKQNSIHIRLDDEGPYGNDETRCFLLSHFSTLGIRTMACVACSAQLSIYDRFPLVDGTLFCSPINYKKIDQNITIEKNSKNDVISTQALVSGKTQFIYVICLACLHSSPEHELKCKACDQTWTGGSNLQIGTMYRYDIFAAFACCQARAACKNCGKNAVDLVNNVETLKYFSSYSEEITCPSCQFKDFHLVKPPESIFNFKFMKKE